MNIWLKRSLVTISAAALAGIFSYTQNNSLTTTEISVVSPNLPDSFQDYKIVHLSDLHNINFGEKQERIIRRVEEEQPDIIVFTGDLFDSNRLEIEPGIILMRELTASAPVYFITGNHEYWISDIEVGTLEEMLLEAGVEVLRNTSLEISAGEGSLLLAGVDDPSEAEGRLDQEQLLHSYISDALSGRDDLYTILLSHRPELFSLYQAHEVDLALTGHAHGGQFRLPFIGGIYAPDQGLFPEYTAGKYKEQEAVMIVNRGLGNSVIPQRIFNRPEIISITLHVSEERDSSGV